MIWDALDQLHHLVTHLNLHSNPRFLHLEDEAKVDVNDTTRAVNHDVAVVAVLT
jgi:hypothetical protein